MVADIASARSILRVATAIGSSPSHWFEVWLASLTPYRSRPRRQPFRRRADFSASINPHGRRGAALDSYHASVVEINELPACLFAPSGGGAGWVVGSGTENGFSPATVVRSLSTCSRVSEARYQ